MKQEVQVVFTLSVDAEISKDDIVNYFRKLEIIHSQSLFWQEKLHFISTDIKVEIKEEAEIYQVEQNDDYCVVCWPDVQDLMDEEGFDENSCLISDGLLYEKYGDSAYFINKNWINNLTK